ncbi:unnamed protein product [Diamesa serratosioi]
MLPVLLDLVDHMYKNLDGQEMNFPEGFPMCFMPQGMEQQGQPGSSGMNCGRGEPRSWGKGQRCSGPCYKPPAPADFQVKIDVASFKPEEISVKVKEQQVIVEGKHEEREDGQGFVTRQFTRRYVVPAEIDLDTISTFVNSTGLMTIRATKPLPPAAESNERSIPIQFLSMSDDEAENKTTKVPAEENKME